MAAIAEGVARAFGRFEPLEAYRLDILGSILGILAFSALSLLQAPPLAWGIVVAVIFVGMLGRSRILQLVPLAVALLVLGVLVVRADDALVARTTASRRRPSASTAASGSA